MSGMAVDHCNIVLLICDRETIKLIFTEKSLVNLPLLRYTTASMLQVTRKDQKEALENLIRRFNRKVQQSGVLAQARQQQYFEKPISKSERRQKAIIRKERKTDKLKKARLGIR